MSHWDPIPVYVSSNNIRPPARPGDVGYDLLAAETVHVEGNVFTKIGTGVVVAFPDHLYGRIVGRSSGATRHGFQVIEGTIDSGYRGELIVVVRAIRDCVIGAGTPFAQLIFAPACRPLIQVTNSPLTGTERGSQGFGSTDGA